MQTYYSKLFFTKPKNIRRCTDKMEKKKQTFDKRFFFLVMSVEVRKRVLRFHGDIPRPVYPIHATCAIFDPHFPWVSEARPIDIKLTHVPTAIPKASRHRNTKEDTIYPSVAPSKFGKENKAQNCFTEMS